MEHDTEPLTVAIRSRLGDRSEAWLAAETGIPQQTLNRWLKDPDQMRMRDVRRIAGALGTSVRALLATKAAA